MSQAGWDKFFIEEAQHYASKSKDRSTKVGAFIVRPETEVPLSGGFNGFPRGVNDDVEERHQRPAKYLFTEHAERNAIYNAANEGTRLHGATMYLMFGPGPCHDCARGIIQSGIREVVMPTNNQFPGKGIQWEDSINAGLVMLKEAGVTLRFVDIG